MQAIPGNHNLQSDSSLAPVPYAIGPYDPVLAGRAMLLRLGLRPAGDASPLGWGTEISGAETELGYNYIGLEERAARGDIDWEQAATLVEKLCACCAQANVLAYTQAVENLAQLIVPPRAAYLRLTLLETERIISHLLNAAEIMRELGLSEREAILRDLRERMVQALAEWSGARTQPGLIIFGGLARNIDEVASRGLALSMRHVERVLRAQVSDIINSREIASRLAGLGVISTQEAQIGGLRGPVARASGVAGDLRSSWPTGAYEEEAVAIIVQRNGDAFSRLVVRLLECLESFRVVEQAMDDLPPGPVNARGAPQLRSGSALGRVEGPKGEVFCWVRGSEEQVEGLHLSAGSFPTVAVLPGLLRGQRLEDIALLLLSLDICLPCVER